MSPMLWIGHFCAGNESAPWANHPQIACSGSKAIADRAIDAAMCGACVAQCPNGAANLFTSAKISHLGLLPQGKPERGNRAISMIEAMDHQGFGYCSNHAECEAVCPKSISIDFIARMNADYLTAQVIKGGKQTGKNRGGVG